MVDETVFRDARRAVNPLPCVFEKAILSGCCRCGLCARRAIAERETVGCRSSGAHDACAEMLARLRANAQFALKIARPGEPVPHAKLMKLQCGGLLGLQRCLDGADAVEDVHTLLFSLRRQYRGLDDLPYSEIMQSVAHFEARRRRRGDPPNA